MADSVFFLGATAFLGAAAFFGAAFLAAGFAVVLVTRPDLVCPSTVGFSLTAGALEKLMSHEICESLMMASTHRRGFLSLRLGGSFRLGSSFLGSDSCCLLRGGSFLGCGCLGYGRLLRCSRLLRSSRLRRLGLRFGELHGSGGALGLCKFTCLDAGLESAVEQRIKGRGRGNVEGVVGEDIFLDCLTAASLAILEL